jgi:hypothetical protein
MKELTETERRAEAGVTVKRMTALIGAMVPPDEAWRLMLSGALVAMFPVLGNEATADTLRQLADDIEASIPTVN